MKHYLVYQMESVHQTKKPKINESENNNFQKIRLACVIEIYAYFREEIHEKRKNK